MKDVYYTVQCSFPVNGFLVSKDQTLVRSDEGLMLETSAF